MSYLNNLDSAFYQIQIPKWSNEAFSRKNCVKEFTFRHSPSHQLARRNYTAKLHTMNHLQSAFIIITMLFVATSCSQTKQKDYEALIDDSLLKISDTDINLSSFIEIKDIIPLETHESCLIGQMEKIVKEKENIYVKSSNQPLLLFDNNGKFKYHIGKTGTGPQEYLTVIDFDVTDSSVYILSPKKIQIFNQHGDFESSIPINLNASGIQVIGNKILLFALGEKHVIYLLDRKGNTEHSILERNQALRLTRANPFVRYGQKILFAQGRSNDILSYDTANDAFEKMQFLTSKNLTIEEEAAWKEEGRNTPQPPQQDGYCFDGLSSTNGQIMFAGIKDEQITLFYKNTLTSNCSAILLSALKNDITFTPSLSFFYDNTRSNKGFLTYIMPYRLKECIEKVKGNHSPYLRRFMEIIKNMNTEEANPILIEYKFKD